MRLIQDPASHSHYILLILLTGLVLWTAVAGVLTVAVRRAGLQLSFALQMCLIPLLVVPSVIGFGIRLPVHFTVSVGTEPPVFANATGLLAQVVTDEPQFYLGVNVLAVVSALILQRVLHKGSRAATAA